MFGLFLPFLTVSLNEERACFDICLLLLHNSQERRCDGPCGFPGNTWHLTLNYAVNSDLEHNSGSDARLSSANLCLHIAQDTKSGHPESSPNQPLHQHPKGTASNRFKTKQPSSTLELDEENISIKCDGDIITQLEAARSQNQR